MLQEISQALCISFEDVCKLQQDNLDLFYWFEKKLEDVEKKCEERVEISQGDSSSLSERVRYLSARADHLEIIEYDLEQHIERLQKEVECLQELLEENGIDYTEAE